MAGVRFYSELNSLSTADLYSEKKPRKRKSLDCRGNYFAVDRLIAERHVKDEEREYLVVWEGYSRFEASFEPESNITEMCISYYKNPIPKMKEVFEFADILREKVGHALIHNRRKETVTFNGRLDVFKYLFGQKDYDIDKWKVLERDDFPVQFIPSGWDTRLNIHGEGMKIHFPVKVRSFIQWSPTKYSTRVADMPAAECKKAPFEKVSIHIIKVAG